MVPTCTDGHEAQMIIIAAISLSLSLSLISPRIQVLKSGGLLFFFVYLFLFWEEVVTIDLFYFFFIFITKYESTQRYSNESLQIRMRMSLLVPTVEHPSSFHDNHGQSPCPIPPSLPLNSVAWRSPNGQSHCQNKIYRNHDCVPWWQSSHLGPLNSSTPWLGEQQAKRFLICITYIMRGELPLILSASLTMEKQYQILDAGLRFILYLGGKILTILGCWIPVGFLFTDLFMARKCQRIPYIWAFHYVSLSIKLIP